MIRSQKCTIISCQLQRTEGKHGLNTDEWKFHKLTTDSSLHKHYDGMKVCTKHYKTKKHFQSTKTLFVTYPVHENLSNSTNLFYPRAKRTWVNYKISPLYLASRKKWRLDHVKIKPTSFFAQRHGLQGIFNSSEKLLTRNGV